MAKYLYGASVQGIQGFIFETNKLKEIVGASDLVERFCSWGFIEEFSKKNNFAIGFESLLRNAGGNIRISFEKKEDIEKMLKQFPQYVMQKAYGITISQAVVEFGESDYLRKKDELEYKLTKARNQASIPLDSRFSLMKQTPRTGKPAHKSIFHKKDNYKDEVEYFDKGNWQKNKNSESGRTSILLEKLGLANTFGTFSVEIDNIANKNNKIAIIHADGNRMGLMLQKMNKSLKGKSTEDIQNIFKTFSEQITKSTNDAVKEAFEKNFNKEDNLIPFRPVVIGGDDVTVICRADDALGFTSDYLKAFEENTKKNFKEHGLSSYAEKLTACAGISFCNKKFPFHYAVDLAEALCGFAKEESKREASCLVFHNIQSSYFTDYKEYIRNELIAKDTTNLLIKLKKLKWSTSYVMTLKDYKFHRDYFSKIITKLLYAPYYTKDKKPTVESLIEVHKKFSDSDIPLGKYREWLTELNKNQEYAELFLDRTDAVLKSKLGIFKYDILEKALTEMDSNLKLNKLIVDNKTPMADILQLKTVMEGKK